MARLRKPAGISNIRAFAVELFTLGLCTPYQPQEIASRLTAASRSLATAVDELQEFSSLIPNEDFNGHLHTCSRLTQLVMGEMEDQAARTSSFITMKKLDAMKKIAQEYEENCRELVEGVQNSSAKVEGSKPSIFGDDLEIRLERLAVLADALHKENAINFSLTVETHQARVPVTSGVPAPNPGPYITSAPYDDVPFDDVEDNFLAEGVVDVGIGPVDQKTERLIARLQELFENKAEYRRLLACQKPSAQRLLDMFQRLLEMPLQPCVQRQLIVAMQRLSAKSGLYPGCYELTSGTTEGDYVCSGGFADIHKGSYQGRQVCLKVVRWKSNQVEHWLKMCSKEVILWGQLSHPNLLPFYGIHRFGNRIAFVSPWIEHETVDAYLKNHPAANRVLLAFDMAQGLQFLHKNGIVHGDLKGKNILVKESGIACLADFGLSSVSDTNIIGWTSVSSVASRGGTLKWQSPELVSEEVTRNTKASDIYALSCVFYEIFTGNAPYHEYKTPAIISKVVNGELPSRPLDSSPSWSTWGLTEEIWSLMKDCWKTDPTERPTIDEVLKRLDPMLPADTRTADSDDALSPTQIRQMAHEGLGYDELTLDVLESFL